MKRTIICLKIILLAVMAGCGERSNQNDDFITVDVTKNYPKKELILQDYMNVEYVPLETSDELITQGDVLDIGKKIILVRNYRDGDLFIFDRTGKGVRKFNRRGNGPGEYLGNSRAFLDEENEEIFVYDNEQKSLKVYDFSGLFKREFNYKESAAQYDKMLNYDKGSFICWNNSQSSLLAFGDAAVKTPFFIISKQNGSIVKEIDISFEEIIGYTEIIINRDNQGNIKNIFAINPAYAFSIINSQGQWVLAEPSVDTVYRYLPDHSIIPFIARTPSIQSMDPQKFILPGVITDHFYFMQIFIKKFDFANQQPFPEIDLLYDRQSKMLFEYTMYNDDYADKRHVTMMGRSGSENDIAFWRKIEAYELVKAYKDGILKGKLKELVKDMDEEDNPVNMLVKHKKL